METVGELTFFDKANTMIKTDDSCRGASDLQKSKVICEAPVMCDGCLGEKVARGDSEVI